MSQPKSTHSDSDHSASTNSEATSDRSTTSDTQRTNVDSESGAVGDDQSATLLFRWYHRHVGQPETTLSVYLGGSLVVLGLVLGLGSLGSFAFSMRLDPGMARYWVAREAAFGLAASALPLLLVGVTMLLSRSQRLTLAANVGTVHCIGAIALFTTVYPGSWRLSAQGAIAGVGGLYAIGLTILVLCVGVTIGTHRRRLHQQEANLIDPDTAPDANTADINGNGDEAGGRATVSESTQKAIDGDYITEDPGANTEDTGLSELHTNLVAAPSITLTSNAAQTGEQWVKTLVIVDYPDVAVSRMLDRTLTRLPDIDLDYSIHIKPRDPTRTIGKLKKSIRDLKVKQAEKAERGDVTQIDTEQTLEDHKAIYSQLVEGSQRIFDVSIYLTVRGDEEEEVEQAAERLTRNLQTSQLVAKSATCRQDDALVCTSPIGKDVLGQTATMLGGAVGCLYPFSSGTIIEEDGVLMGYHSVTGSPVVVNRFDREKGYNCFIAGNTGAGKTFNTILSLLRTYAKDEETLVIVADPFGDLGVLTDILGGEQVVMSGKRGLNPLEITPTPESVLKENPDLDPYTKTVQKDVMEFIQAFFALEEMSLTGKRGILSVAIKEAYRRQDITPDPATHHNESPTFRDVQDILTDITQNPAEYIGDEPDAIPELEADLWRKRASQLRMDLAPFREGGEYANLARQTEIDITGADVLYLDMQQIEGKQKTGLMLQLVLRAVYERAKQTDKKVIFAIDEAHYLMQNEASLSFLERATRHARHYDLSLQLITQTVDEFFSRADEDELAQKTKAIADNCALKIFHQVEGLTDPNAEEWLGLAPPEAEFIRNAKPGSEEYGYSQALIEVGEAGRFPVNVHALPEEETLITNATTAQSKQMQGKDGGASHRDLSVEEPGYRAIEDQAEDTDFNGPTTDVTNSGCDEGQDQESNATEGKNRQLVDAENQHSKLEDELDQTDIAKLLNNADPVELRKALDREGLENIDKCIHEHPND